MEDFGLFLCFGGFCALHQARSTAIRATDLGPFSCVCAPCGVRACAVCPAFARVVRELQAADGANASSGAQSEALRSWKLGQQQHSTPENI